MGVAARDVYWSIALQDMLLENEQNPVGKWLIQMDDGSVALFMALKTFGLGCVASLLTCAYLLRCRYTMVVLSVVTLAQICLLIYLEK